MTRRFFGQPSLADALVKSNAGRGGFLEDQSKTFDWGAIAALFAQINAKTFGAPGYPPLAIFKIVLLQQWYCLSDPAAEEAVRDRLSFRRFCGVPLDCETASGAKTARAQLGRALAQLDSGDVLMVPRLDRLARPMRDLLDILAQIAAKGASFRSLSDTWADTTTAHGRLMLTILGGLAEFERELIKARTGEGRERAKARGAKMGRKPKLAPRQMQEARNAL